MTFQTGKERTVLVIALGALLANALLTFGNLDGLVAVQRDVNRSHQVLAELARLEGTLRSAEAAQRTFLATEGRTSLASLEAARTVLGIRLDRLGEMVRDDAGSDVPRLSPRPGGTAPPRRARQRKPVSSRPRGAPGRGPAP